MFILRAGINYLFRLLLPKKNKKFIFIFIIFLLPTFNKSNKAVEVVLCVVLCIVLIVCVFLYHRCVKVLMLYFHYKLLKISGHDTRVQL